MMTSSCSWRWALVADPLATSSSATLIFSPCATVRRYSSVTACGCIEFQSYTCIKFALSSPRHSVGAAGYKLGGRLRCLLRTPIRRNPNWIQESHQLAQSGSHLLDRVGLLALARGVEPRPPRFVFCNPFSCVLTALNFAQHAAHGLSRFVRDQLRSAGVVAVLGGIADGIPHVVQAPAVHQIHNQLQLMHAFEVSDLRLVSSLDQGFKAGFYERAYAAA